MGFRDGAVAFAIPLLQFLLACLEDLGTGRPKLGLILLGFRRGLNALGRWKLTDNLRRSLGTPALKGVAAPLEVFSAVEMALIQSVMLGVAIVTRPGVGTCT